MIYQDVMEIRLYSTAPHLKRAQLLHIAGEEKCRKFLTDFLTEESDKRSPPLEASITYKDGRVVSIKK
jgi:hypothetical protein